MAGRAMRHRADEERITIAIGGNRDDIEVIPGGRALLPQFLPAPAPEPDMRASERPLQGVRVHVADHQDGLRRRVLHDGGDESVAIPTQGYRVKQCWCIGHARWFPFGIGAFVSALHTASEAPMLY